MSVVKILRSKKLWIGLGAACLAMLLCCAVGAALQSKGVLQEQAGEGIVCLAFAAAGLIGTLAAGRGENGALLRGAVVSVVWIAVILLLSLVLGMGTDLSGGWKQLLCVPAGAVLGSLLCAKRKGGRRRPFTKRRRGPRAARPT